MQIGGNVRLDHLYMSDHPKLRARSYSGEPAPGSPPELAPRSLAIPTRVGDPGTPRHARCFQSRATPRPPARRTDRPGSARKRKAERTRQPSAARVAGELVLALAASRQRPAAAGTTPAARCPRSLAARRPPSRAGGGPWGPHRSCGASMPAPGRAPPGHQRGTGRRWPGTAWLQASTFVMIDGHMAFSC